MAYPNARLILVITWLILVAGCARLPSIEKTHIRAKTLGDLQAYLTTHKAELGVFRLRGPFDVARLNDYEIRVSDSERFNADIFFAAHAGRAPLVLLLHGHEASKELHAQQAIHIASWGLHALALQLPNTGPWITNGRMLRGIVAALSSGSSLSDSRIDTGRIILAGHSFGAAAVAIALAEGTPALGGILLDPASQEKGLPGYLAKIKTPLMIIGADDQYTRTTNREYFFRYMRSGVSEVSIKDAIHEDAQFPSDDSKTTESLQITFASAVTSAALSLHMTGKFDYAWASFETDLKKGALLFPKRK
jgi:hypothetical protein